MIEKVKVMYDLMVEKFKSSPHGRNQAEAYRKIRAFADEWDSVEEMTIRLQNEGYNKLPAVALIADKVEAHYQAAVENGLEEHINIYRRVLDDIDANPDNAYLTGFYDDIKRADERYVITLERIMTCFNDYLHFKIKNEIPPNVTFSLEEWNKEERSFEEVIYKKAFRCHFACSDDFIECFINEFDLLVAGKLKGGITVSSEQYEVAFNALKKEGMRRCSLAEIELPRYGRAIAMSVAPPSAEEDYEYIEIELSQ